MPLPLVTGKNLVDKVMVDHYRIRDTKIAATTYAPVRERIFANAQATIFNVCTLRDFTFLYVDDQITLLGGDTDVDFPAGFSTEGLNGGIWHANLKYRIPFRRSGIITHLINTDPGHGDPTLYTVVNSITARFWRGVDVDTPLLVRYKSAGPTISDDENDLGLAIIPERWRLTVIYEGTVLREMMDMKDFASAAGQKAKFDGALFNMLCEEQQGEPETWTMPIFPGATGYDAE